MTHPEIMAVYARALGAREVTIDRKGRHPRLTIRRADGIRFRICVSGTPSCHRTILNEQTRIRRKFAATEAEDGK